MNSGYTTILINGQTVGLKFGLPALKQLGEFEKKVPFYDGNNYSDLGMAHIIYAGYCNNQFIKTQDVTYQFEDFYNVVEECLNDAEQAVSVLRPIIECFEQSRYVAPVAAKPGEDEGKKKNGLGTKSKATATVNLG